MYTTNLIKINLLLNFFKIHTHFVLPSYSCNLRKGFIDVDSKHLFQLKTVKMRESLCKHIVKDRFL